MLPRLARLPGPCAIFQRQSESTPESAEHDPCPQLLNSGDQIFHALSILRRPPVHRQHRPAPRTRQHLRRLRRPHPKLHVREHTSPAIATVYLDSDGANIVRDIDKERDRFRNGLQHQPLHRSPNKATYCGRYRKGPLLVRGIDQDDDSHKNQRRQTDLRVAHCYAKSLLGHEDGRYCGGLARLNDHRLLPHLKPGLCEGQAVLAGLEFDHGGRLAGGSALEFYPCPVRL